MKPTWVLSAPCGTHVGPINLAIGMAAWHEWEAAIDVSVILGMWLGAGFWWFRTLHSRSSGFNMGPTWVLSDPCGTHVGPINLAIGVVAWHECEAAIDVSVILGMWLGAGFWWFRTLHSRSSGFNMGPTWVLSDPCGTHVGPINLAIGVVAWHECEAAIDVSVILGMWLGGGFWWFRTLHSRSSGFNMGPTWVLSDPCGTHVGPINLAIGVVAWHECEAAIDVSVILGMWLGGGFWWFRTLHSRSIWYCKLLIQVALYVYSFQNTNQSYFYLFTMPDSGSKSIYYNYRQNSIKILKKIKYFCPKISMHHLVRRP